MQLPLPLVRLTRIPVRYGRRVAPRSIRRYAGVITLGLMLLAWQLLVMSEALPSYQLPAPAAVWAEFVDWLSTGRLWPHIWTTVVEVVSGLAFGVLFAVALGYVIAHSPLLDDVLSPMIVALQSTPVVAYAPLLVIWFPGITSKTITSALIVFFPMLMSTVVGIRNVPPTLIALMRVSQATRRQMFVKLEAPAAMPVLLSGLKTAATLSVIGAVVGELINGNAGLGHLVRLGLSQYDIPLVFVAVILLAALAISLYQLVSALERRLLHWQQFE
ncbi:MAG: ABC transporter permease [Anaerolineae bacterium]|jgi:NitT/TauT family transport system permease protein|nr:ABC transporter permease [Anaerolineae bacterium]